MYPYTVTKPNNEQRMHGDITVDAFVNGAWGRVQKIDPNFQTTRRAALKRAKLALMRWKDNYAQFRDVPLRAAEDGVRIA